MFHYKDVLLLKMLLVSISIIFVNHLKYKLGTQLYISFPGYHFSHCDCILSYVSPVRREKPHQQYESGKYKELSTIVTRY